jgi:predicted nuclease with TOPRIM domain
VEPTTTSVLAPDATVSEVRAANEELAARLRELQLEADARLAARGDMAYRGAAHGTRATDAEESRLSHRLEQLRRERKTLETRVQAGFGLDRRQELISRMATLSAHLQKLQDEGRSFENVLGNQRRDVAHQQRLQDELRGEEAQHQAELRAMRDETKRLRATSAADKEQFHRIVARIERAVARRRELEDGRRGLQWLAALIRPTDPDALDAAVLQRRLEEQVAHAAVLRQALTFQIAQAVARRPDGAAGSGNSGLLEAEMAHLESERALLRARLSLDPAEQPIEASLAALVGGFPTPGAAGKNDESPKKRKRRSHRTDKEATL